MAAFDTENGRLWFACIPDSDDINTEGVCYAPYTKSTENAPVSALVWAEKKLTITSIAWSRALGAVVVVAQGEDTNDNPVDTKVFLADPGPDADGTAAISLDAQVAGPGKGEVWPMLLDLGQAYGDLNQATISADGKYLTVILRSGNRNFPTQTLVTVNLDKKSIADSIKIGDNKAVAIVMPIPC